jgi:iron complex transport system substrate-binding protein
VPTRRSFLLAAAAAAATAGLSACGGGGTRETSASGSSGTGDFPRTVPHELGETEIPARPERVVCGTDGGELCSLLALGVQPVGFGQRNDPLRPWVADLAEGIETYDLSGGETNFERLVGWAPDLLLVQNGFATDENLSRFEQIAPTVATSFIDWRANLRQVAEAVGLEEEAADLEARTDDAVAAIRSELPAAAEGLVLRAATAFPDGTVYALNDASPLGKVAEALGLAPLPAAQAEGEAVDEVSLEQLDVLDGDLLLLLNFGADSDGTAQLTERSVFQRLGVVTAGNVVEVPEDESHSLYFDSVLTVEPNARLLERVLRDAVA